MNFKDYSSLLSAISTENGLARKGCLVNFVVVVYRSAVHLRRNFGLCYFLNSFGLSGKILGKTLVTRFYLYLHSPFLMIPSLQRKDHRGYFLKPVLSFHSLLNIFRILALHIMYCNVLL
jgi:hypothetical protein